MAKFALFFALAFCLVQNVPATFAQTEKEQASIENIVKVVGNFAIEIKEIVQDLSDRVPLIIKNLESSITKVVGEFNLTEPFENVRKEIEKLISDESSTGECVKMASEELEDLNQKTKTDITNCITKVKEKSSFQIKDDVKRLIENVNVIAKDMTKKIGACAEDFPEDAVEMANCLQNEINESRKMLKQMKDGINETVDVAEGITGEVAEEIGVCLKEVKTNTLRNTAHVSDELQSCILEA